MFPFDFSILLIKMSKMSVNSAMISQRTLSNNNFRKKSWRNIVKQKVGGQTDQSYHKTIDEDTLEFTQLENIKHVNGLARVRRPRPI